MFLTNASEGRATVILDKTVYTEKANHLLQDTTTYLPSNADAAKKMNRRTKSKLESLRNSGAISKKEFDWIKPSDSAFARFYGLPKSHKSGTASRPIVTLQGSPLYNFYLLFIY